jgi:type I restriction enzyme, S subunit
MSFPSNWKNVKFGDIAQQIVERIDDPQKSGYNSYIGLEHIETEQINIQKYGDAKEVKSSKFLCQKGDIIFGRRRAYLRKLAVCDRDSLVSSDAMVIRPKKEVIKEYLILMMQTDYFWEKAISLSAGSLSPRVKWRELSTIEFYLPPFDVQKKISDILWSIQDNLEKIEKLIQITEKLKKGLLEELITRKKWELINFGEKISLVKGKAPKKELGEIKSNLKLPYLNTDLLRDSLQNIFLPKNDFMVEVTNKDVIILWDGSNAGEIFRGKEGYLSSTMTKLVYDKTEYDNNFLYYFLKTKEFEIKSQCKGTGIPHVDKEIIESLQLPLISYQEQQKIVKILKQIFNAQYAFQENLNITRILKKKLTNEFLSGSLLIPKEVLN